MKSGRPAAPEVRGQAMALYRAGVPLKQIAFMADVTLKTLYAWAKQENCVRNPRKPK